VRDRCPTLSIIVLAALSLACGPPSVASEGGEFGDDEGTGEGGSCMLATPAATMDIIDGLEGDFDGDLAAGDDWIVSSVQQDPDIPTRWTFGFASEDELIEIGVVVDPPLLEAPFTVGESLALFYYAELGDAFALQALGEDGLSRLALSNLQQPVNSLESAPFASPFFPNPVEIEWTSASGCTSVDTQCGVVEHLRAEVELTTPLEDGLGGVSVATTVLEPDQRHVEIGASADNNRYGIWLGDNWSGECDGQLTVQTSYVVAALP
jgi:hypothetical protein